MAEISNINDLADLVLDTVLNGDIVVTKDLLKEYSEHEINVGNIEGLSYDEVKEAIAESTPLTDFLSIEAGDIHQIIPL